MRRRARGRTGWTDDGPGRPARRAGGGDAAIRLWDPRTGALLRTFGGPRTSVASLCLSADGTRLLSGDHSGEVRLWDTGTGECLRVLPDNYALLDPDRWSPDFRGCTRIALPGGGTLPDDVVMGGAHVRFGPGERSAVVGGVDGIVRIWDLGTGAVVHAMDCAGGARGLVPDAVRIEAVAVAGDRLAVSAHWDGVHVWDVSGGGHLRILGEGDHASCVAAPADGRFVVAGHRDGAVRVWELDWEPSPRVHPGGTDT
ncbi:WD40 repeat domain-containing protein [Actinomadura sp. WAC 06369]|uniref:WD40 repeat domain-containing protein n=1 Tax=Actinomadura sp. WAC 06369 TaxID=2203193 RepID=UPI000F79F771|nr:hypothetical protein [Actinomadura sp. WAC 06369]RSN67786.1 hypothetical protein DMH08_12585 [Actinomadura sp. WAC 06369]